MQVLLLSADLTVQSKVAGAAARSGSKLSTVANFDLLCERANESRPDLVIIDLGMPRLDVSRAVTELRPPTGPGVKIIAFGPHVHEVLLQSASDAGCDAVLARGQFYARLDEILRGATNKD